MRRLRRDRLLQIGSSLTIVSCPPASCFCCSGYRRLHWIISDPSGGVRSAGDLRSVLQIRPTFGGNRPPSKLKLLAEQRRKSKRRLERVAIHKGGLALQDDGGG